MKNECCKLVGPLDRDEVMQMCGLGGCADFASERSAHIWWPAVAKLQAASVPRAAARLG